MKNVFRKSKPDFLDKYYGKVVDRAIKQLEKEAVKVKRHYLYMSNNQAMEFVISAYKDAIKDVSRGLL